jgi:hypothetical protein
MEVLLVVAMLAVGASALFVAATFEKRVTRQLGRLVRNAVNGTAAVTPGADNDLDRWFASQLRLLGDDFGRRLAAAEAQTQAAHGELTKHLIRLDAKADGIGRRVETARQERRAGGDADSQTARRVAESAQRLEALASGQDRILCFLRALLDEEEQASDGSGRRRIVTTAVQADNVAMDVITELTEAFCAAFGFSVLLPASSQQPGRELYLAWRSTDSASLEQALAAVLVACADEQSPPLAGLDELRRLALGLYGARSGSVTIGPMVVNRGRTDLTGWVLASRGPAAPLATDLPVATQEPDGQVPDEPGQATQPTLGPSPRAQMQQDGLQQPGQRREVELTPWAKAYWG